MGRLGHYSGKKDAKQIKREESRNAEKIEWKGSHPGHRWDRSCGGPGDWADWLPGGASRRGGGP